jgi:uncharacterized protein YbbK (DUF523 family)/uncharacterized protein YbgA (DUF1722 family)
VIAARPVPPLKVGISECLTGAQVRYDGDHKRDGLPHTQELEALFEWRGLCPEVAVGMGVPRPPIRLIGDLAAPRAVRVDDASQDFTDVLAGYAATVTQAVAQDLAGYVFTENSPSCGLHSVKVYAEGSDEPVPLGRGRGRGVYAGALCEALPQLPVEEAERLSDGATRESFVDKVFAYAHWSAVRHEPLSAAAVAEFHACYEYLLMAHSVAHWRSVRALLRDFEGPPDAIGDRYLSLLLAGLGQTATPASHSNALLHLKGQLGDALDRARQRELESQITEFRAGKVAFQDVSRALREECATSGRLDLRNQVYLTRPGT